MHTRMIVHAAVMRRVPCRAAMVAATTTAVLVGRSCCCRVATVTPLRTFALSTLRLQEQQQQQQQQQQQLPQQQQQSQSQSQRCRWWWWRRRHPPPPRARRPRRHRRARRRGSDSDIAAATAPPHRVARRQPWWRDALLFVGLLVVVNVFGVVYYGLHRLYHAWWPRGNNTAVMRSVDELLFARPDLAVAAVRMALHHALSNTTTPFGCPIVAPPSCAAEAEALCDWLWSLHTQHGRCYSLADLWAITTSRALARLGGPHVRVLYGRRDDDGGDSDTPPSRARMLVYTPSRVRENVRDVLTLKRVMHAQGMTPAEAVALVACARSLGYHEAGHVHTTAAVTPATALATCAQQPPASATTHDGGAAAAVVDTIDKCTCDPYVFSSVYFDLLLDYHWRREGDGHDGDTTTTTAHARRGRLHTPLSPSWRWWRGRRGATTTAADDDDATSVRYRCRADDRRRHIRLVAVDDSPRARARERAHAHEQNDEHKQQQQQSDAVTTAAGDTTQREAVTSGDDCAKDDDDASMSAATAAPPPPPFDPCQHVSMRAMDVMLLDDALTRGWLVRYSNSEPEYATTLSRVMAQLQLRGYDVNALRVTH